MSISPFQRRAALSAAFAGVAASALPATAQTSGETRSNPTIRRNERLVRGFSRERLARIGPAMTEEAKRGSFPGAVTLIARGGEIVHFEGHWQVDGRWSEQPGGGSLTG